MNTFCIKENLRNTRTLVFIWISGYDSGLGLVFTQGAVPAHVGDWAWDATFANAGGAGLASRKQTLCGGRRGAKRLGCFRSGWEVQRLCGSFLLSTTTKHVLDIFNMKRYFDVNTNWCILVLISLRNSLEMQDTLQARSKSELGCLIFLCLTDQSLQHHFKI